MVATTKKYIAAAALGLAVAAVASPGFAQGRRDADVYRGIAANAAARGAALHDCNVSASKYTQTTWGSEQIQRYRSCMAQHGEPE